MQAPSHYDGLACTSATPARQLQGVEVTRADRLSRRARNPALEQIIVTRLAKIAEIAAWEAWLVVDDAADALQHFVLG